MRSGNSARLWRNARQRYKTRRKAKRRMRASSSTTTRTSATLLKRSTKSRPEFGLSHSQIIRPKPRGAVLHLHDGHARKRPMAVFGSTSCRLPATITRWAGTSPTDGVTR